MLKQNESTSEAFNIKEFILTVLNYKYLYIASLVIFISGAFLINKVSPTIYQVNSIIGPVDDKRSSLLGSNNLFSGLGAFAESKNLENDMNSLNSFSIVSTTLSKLNLEIGYFVEKERFLGPTQIYYNSPFKVSIDKSHIQPIYARFYIKILDNNYFRLTSSEEGAILYNYLDNAIISRDNSLKIDTVCRFNETIINKNFKFSVSLSETFSSVTDSDESLLYFELYHLDYLTQEYLEKLSVEPVTLKSSLINVSFQGDNIELTIDFLNSYVQSYLNDNLSKKNKIALNTINFIDSQISEISDSLLSSESKLKDYRSANQVTDLSYQGQKALEQMTQIEEQRSTLQVQERYYNYILDYFNKNNDIAGLAPPSVANVVDPIMNQLILSLLALNAERSTILSNNNEKNLFLGQIENKIKLQKQTIIENVSNNLNTLSLSMNELNYRAEKLSNEISKLPRTQINMVSMQRKFNLSDAIYTFLLQKRSEAAITMASNIPDYEILEPAREISAAVISPKRTFNLIIAFFLALMIPTTFIILKSFFNDKIMHVYEVEHIINRSVQSIIYTNPYKTEGVVSEFPGSSMAESFRNLRSSLLLKFKSEPVKVILVTSSQPQEGKSFIAFNLATSIASVGYKTIILDCDMRRPTLHDKFKVANSTGLSTYITNLNSKDDIIHTIDPTNLSYITAGPFLPNSSELIEAGALDELIDFLKSKYEYIILDTAPLGLVADALLMMKYTTHNVLVCRNNFTKKDVFIDVLKTLQTNKVENFDIVYNDLSIKKSRYGRYNNYYKKDKKQ
jgi:tyrosine-protein kinase Etk/Wzc